MGILVTGASGFVGSAVVQELLRAGYEVTGLARSDASAKALHAAGASVYRSDLTDLENLKKAVAQSDGVIHTGFNHDFSKFKENCENDQRTIEAMGSVLAGSSRPLIITSGTGLLNAKSNEPVTENELPPKDSPNPRVLTELAAHAVAEKGVRVSLVRLPPSVHGIGDHGFIPKLIDLARKKGLSAYLGEGSNRWSAVHRLDAAQVFKLAFEKNEKMANYHAVGDEGILFKDIAIAIGQGLNVPVASKSQAEAAAHFEWFQHFAAMDAFASSKLTQERLGWKPTHKGLLADINRPEYLSPQF